MFMNFTFIGSGKVNNPGDPGARGLAFSSKIDTTEFLEKMNEHDLFLSSKVREEFNNFIENDHYNADECPCESFASDFPKEEGDAEKLVWLFICEKKNPSLFDSAISELIGEDMAGEKKFTQEELDTIVAEKIESYKTSSQATAEVEGFKSQLSEKDKQIKTLEETNTGLANELKTAQDEIKRIQDEQAKAKLISDRIEILKSEEIVYDEKTIAALISNLDEEQFKTFKSALAFAGKKKEDKKEDKTKDKKYGKADAEDSQSQHKEINDGDNDGDGQAAASQSTDMKTVIDSIFAKARK
jgi:hypothetical protein